MSFGDGTKTTRDLSLVFVIGLAVIIGASLVCARGCSKVTWREYLNEHPPFPGQVPGDQQSSAIRPEGISEDDAHRAALRIAWPLPSCSPSYLGGTVKECDKAMGELNRKRREFSDFDPAWMRTEIMRWFDYAEGQIKENRQDCESRTSATRLREYQEKRREEEDRTKAVLDLIGHKGG